MIYQELLEKKTKLALVGLGYVGMPIAVSFSKKIDVIGFDLNSEKIRQYQNGIDPTNEVGDTVITTGTMQLRTGQKVKLDSVIE